MEAEERRVWAIRGAITVDSDSVEAVDSAVKEILFAMAPVSLDDLAEMISLEYGTREDTIKANWLNCISEYYHHGMYSVEYEDMPEEHVQKLKEVLVNDFYFMTELRRIYKNLVDDADLSLLSTYNLRKWASWLVPRM